MAAGALLVAAERSATSLTRRLPLRANPAGAPRRTAPGNAGSGRRDAETAAPGRRRRQASRRSSTAAEHSSERSPAAAFLAPARASSNALWQRRGRRRPGEVVAARGGGSARAAPRETTRAHKRCLTCCLRLDNESFCWGYKRAED